VEPKGTEVRFGVIAPFVDGLITSGDFLKEYAAVLEECGAESVWTVEHVVVAETYDPSYPYSPSGRMAGRPGSTPMPDPLELLAFLACASSRLRLGTAMMVAPLHSPAVLAKRVATVDRLSGGRVELGLGIGWQREEYEAVGVPFSHRGERLEECIGALRVLWSESPASFGGHHVSFERVFSDPRPTGRIPILVGGHSEPAVRRAGRLADGWFPFTIAPDEFAAGAEMMRKEAVLHGRDPGDIEITAWPASADPEAEFSLPWARRYADAGATRLIVHGRIGATDQLDDLRHQLDRFREEVASRL
jgi:probable F420-dependent oxidoreductase